MIAQASPTMKEQAPFASTLHVSEVRVVEPPSRIHTRDAGVLLLLPIEPEKVDALSLDRVVKDGEVVLRELLVGDIEWNVRVRRRIDSHRPSDLGVLFLERLHAGSWMHVERCLEPLLVHPIEESGRFRKVDLVPGVSGPS